MIKYVKYNIKEELEKLVDGKKTKVDVEYLLYVATNRYPRIQAKLGRAFGIKEW
jgi:adenylyl- and sulfurtransferase ThiI